MHLLIILRGYHPATSPGRIGEFLWDADAQAYIWEGRRLAPDEFNETIAGVLERNHDLWAHPITVRAVSTPNNNQPHNA